MASNNRYCFYPSHETKQIDSPCFPDKDVSPCCSDDMVCLGNGLCHNEKTGILTRGTCTDSTWKSPLCPQYCLKNEFKGEGANNYTEHSVATWSCSDRWAGEGGLMCCNIQATWNGEFNRSCCPGVGAINLFSLGSKPGTVKLIPLSASSPPPTRSSRSKVTASLISSSSFFTTLSSTATLSSAAKPTAASSDELASPVSSSAPSRSISKGSTVAMAVGISVGALALIIASYLIYRRRQRRNKKNSKQDHLAKEEKKTPELEEFYHPKELDGRQEHELPSSEHQDHELPSSERQISEMPSFEQYTYGKVLAKSRFSRQELAG